MLKLSNILVPYCKQQVGADGSDQWLLFCFCFWGLHTTDCAPDLTVWMAKMFAPCHVLVTDGHSLDFLHPSLSPVLSPSLIFYCISLFFWFVCICLHPCPFRAPSLPLYSVGRFIHVVCSLVCPFPSKLSFLFLSCCHIVLLHFVSKLFFFYGS